MANNRIYYPMQQITFRKPGTSTFVAVHGVQSVSMTTTFNLEQAFELGQLAIYENIEGVPDVEISLTKVLDGYPPIFLLAAASKADGAVLDNPTLAGRAIAETVLQMGIWSETDNNVAGSPDTYVEMSGLTVSSVSYSFPSEDNFTEDVTMAGNTRVWNTYADGACVAPWTLAESTGDATFSANDDAPIGSGGVNRRENFRIADTTARAGDADWSRLPGDIFGVSAGGVKSGLVRVASASVSTDMSREDLFELGTRSPYSRTVTFPIEVTSEFEVTSASGDQVNAIDDCASAAACVNASNLSDREIRLSTCEGLRIYLGVKNKLASVSYGGGDAGGGNVSSTYSYTTFNDFTVLHSGDNYSASGQIWWDARSGHLGPAGTTQGTA